MKKYLFLLGVLLLPISVYASSGSINITSSTSQIAENKTFEANVTLTSSIPISSYEYTLDYDKDILSLIKGDEYVQSGTSNSNTKEVKKTFTFKVKKATSTTITVQSYGIVGYDRTKISPTVKPLTINNSKKNIANTSDNYLASLKVKDQKLSPKFSKNTSNYTVNLKDELDEITIEAVPENTSSTLTGTGTFKLSPGENKFLIKVTDSDKKERIYKIIINNKDSEPIKVTINNKTYTVVKNSNVLDIPNYFKVQEIEIEGQNVKALYNDKLNIALVGLKDEDDNISLYIYNDTDNSYTLYQEINYGDLTIVPTKPETILENYSKYNETINSIDLECYKISSGSNYCLIYGINTKTGEKDWYSYNKEDGTIQKYNMDLDKYYQNKINNSNILIYILSGAILIFGIITIVLAIKLNKKKVDY